MDKNKKSTHLTLKAVKKFNRRTAIKRGAALAAFASVAPTFVKNAFAATSGEVNVLMWGEYLPDSVVADFKAKTGITINHTKIGDNGEIIAKMKAGGGAGFDLASPTNMRALQWENLGVLAPFDMSKITNITLKEPLLDIPEMNDLVFDLRLKSIADYFFGVDSFITGINVRKTIANDFSDIFQRLNK